MPLIPAPFLFHFQLPVPRVDRLPRAKAPLLQLPKECRMALPSALGGEEAFAALSLAWNPHGFAVQVEVHGKQQAPYYTSGPMGMSDAVRLWIDTRGTQSVHRGTRFCHHFAAYPSGGGATGTEPWVKQIPVPRAREDAPQIDVELLLLECDVHSTGYRMSLWFPSDALHGYDPETQSRLGFYLAVSDHELGKQLLSVGDEFPYEADPSQWVALQLEATT